MNRFTPRLDPRRLYDRFDAPTTEIDCGERCAPHHPENKPFCCDICQAVPAAYHQEWDYLRKNTDLWHKWRGDECPEDTTDREELRASTPRHMTLLACKGAAHCQRNFRALSCRQFPFFPYVTSDYRFIGLAYEWFFEPVCWVISNLGSVSADFRREFVQTYDELFAVWQAEFDSYAALSEEMREHFAGRKRRIPILHRNGGYYLVSPARESMRKVRPEAFQKFGVYRG